MADSHADDPSISDVVTSAIAQLEEEDNHVLSAVQIDHLLDSTQFMRTSSKSMTGVFVNEEERVQVIRVIGQVAEDFDLLGSLKYKTSADVR